MSRQVQTRRRGEQARQRREKGQQARRALRKRQQAEGLVPRVAPAMPNRTSSYATVEEEAAAREEAVTKQLEVMRSQFPILLARLAEIDDPRNPKKLKHKLTVLLVYGILVFVYQMASRREANRTMTRPVFMENLRQLFPELGTLPLPHQDTLNRLLSQLDVSEIEDAHLELVRRLIRKKKFVRYLIDEGYPIAIDGTQKLVRSELLSEEWLERQVSKGQEKETQYFVYVAEASLAFQNGMTIPLLSEFLDYTQGDTSNDKQDCEQRAFRRLVARLKREFPRLPIMLLLDGLYANGPVMKICCKNNWEFMIVLQDKSLPSVWEEFNGLIKLEPKNRFEQPWGDRRQVFQWVNGIEYDYGPNQRKRQKVHVVVCQETWEEVDKVGEVVTKTSRHAWLSSQPLTRRNVHGRCNLGARHRWGIESGFLVEKRHGYQYEHCFSHSWNGMRGYHHLMRLAHLFNILAEHSESLAKLVLELGRRGFIRLVRETMAGPWLDTDKICSRLAGSVQLRLT